MIFFDLDDFKNINDAHGHEVGDAVLKETSKILLSCLRENDIVSRFGGDEFVIVLPQLEDETRVLDVIKRIQNKLLQPILYNDIKHTITASMGISLYPKDAQDISSLLKHADIAMYRSKELGKNKYSFFTNTLNNLLLERMKIQKTILNALENDYFKLYYQPKVDIVSGDITGCEALIRLIDPNEGLIPPDKFISIAEQNNLIIPIGEWVIKEATAQIKRWENSPLASLKVSINVSGVQFKDPTLLDVIQKAIQNIDCKKLDIELTESVLMHDFDTNLKTIEAFKALGLTLSLDDFGTGYSSLSYLKDIPFDTIKIDKSFVDDITTDTKALTFVQIIISIANNFSLEVVAEGVETQEQLKLLQEMECDIYQGYYMSRPLCVKEFEKLYISTQGT